MKIVTHDSSFHTDDLFAVATLSLALGKVEIVRSRDPEVQATTDYLVDTGMKYDPENHFFDHHQPGGAGMRENGIPYASFGLVWKEYGEKLAGGKREAELIDRKLVQGIDAHDNGLALEEYKFPGIRSYSIGDFINSFINSRDQDKIDEIFMDLLDMAKGLLNREIILARNSIEKEEKLLDLYNDSEDKRIIVMTEDFPDWREVLGKTPEAIYGIYQTPDGKWRIKGVPDLSKPYYGPIRKLLPLEWAGKENEELQTITGVPDAIFAHGKSFMAATKTKEGAVKLAEIALNA